MTTERDPNLQDAIAAVLERHGLRWSGGDVVDQTSARGTGLVIDIATLFDKTLADRVARMESAIHQASDLEEALDDLGPGQRLVLRRQAIAAWMTADEAREGTDA